MSKTSKRKGGGESGKSSGEGKTSFTAGGGSEGSGVKRQSVFERLGTKTASSRESLERSLSSSVVASVSQQQVAQDSAYCRSWVKNGICPFGKGCKLAFSHLLISPSKRGINKDLASSSRRPTEEEKQRILLSTVVRGGAADLALGWDCWDQNDLEYEDEKALEKRRALLQRELKLQMKKEGGRKEPVKRRSSSTSSATSSTSNTSSSSVTSSSSGSLVRGKTDKPKSKRQSTSSPSDTDKPKKGLSVQTNIRKDSPGRKFLSGGSNRGRPRSIERKRPSSPPPRKSSSSSKRRSLSPPSRKQSPKSGKTTQGGSTRRIRDSPSSGRRGSPRDVRRSPSRGRRRSPTSLKARSSRKSSRPRSPDLPKASSSRLLSSSRGRSSESKKGDDRKKEDLRRDRKADYRDKRDDSRTREKAREMREVAREKERSEALERCRERQREREQKEKDRLRDDRDRKDVGSIKRNRGSVVSSSDKRSYDRYEGRGKGSERDRSYEKERVRDRALERVMERGPSDTKRDRSRDSYGGDRYSDSSRRLLPADDKHYSSSPYRTDRSRYEADRVSPRDDRVSRCSYGSDDRRPERPRVVPGRQERGDSTVRYDEPLPREKVVSGSVRSEFRDRTPPRAPVVPSVGGEWDAPPVSSVGPSVDEWAKSVSQGADWLRSHPHLEERRERSRDKESSKDRDVQDTSLLGKRPPPPPQPVSRPENDELDDVVAPGSASSSIASAPIGTSGASAAKKSRIDPDPALSDISDDPDDILNQDDDFPSCESAKTETPSKGSDLNSTAVSNGLEGAMAQRHSLSSNMESRIDEDPMDASFGDFEEISDEELEEDKVLKGGSVGDALGVDWASLMAECKPDKRDCVGGKGENEPSKSDPKMVTGGGVRRLWEASAIFSRTGISLAFAGPEVYKKLKEKYSDAFEPVEVKSERPASVDYLKTRLAKMKEARNLGHCSSVTDFLCHKRALSARADIAIRRQLCGLPVVTLETHQNTGFVQWAI